jgi:hypothetical protein
MRGLIAIATGVVAFIAVVKALIWLADRTGTNPDGAAFILAPVVPFVFFGGICVAMITYAKLSKSGPPQSN